MSITVFRSQKEADRAMPFTLEENAGAAIHRFAEFRFSADGRRFGYSPTI